jgi:hypothetical protein
LQDVIIWRHRWKKEKEITHTTFGSKQVNEKMVGDFSYKDEDCWIT